MLQVTKDILGEIKSLEPFPQVALRAMQVASQEDAGPTDLVSVIEADPGLVAKVLKLCNSAYYGFQREISSLREAGVLLGLETLVSLVVTTCTNKYFRDFGESTEGSRKTLWERNLATALSARLVASLKHEVDGDRAYTAGLLQNVGHIVLDRFLVEQRAEILSELDHGLSLLQAEKAVLGMHHAELGARLAVAWNLPEVLVDSIRYHHQPDYAESDHKLSSIMHLAESITWSVGYGEGVGEKTYGISRTVVEEAGLNRQNFEVLQGLLQKELNRAEELIDS